MMMTTMMAFSAGWWFWWLYQRGEPYRKTLGSVCTWVEEHHIVLQQNPYAALFESTISNPSLGLLRQRIQEALFAGYDLHAPLRDLYRTLRRLQLELYTRQQVLRLFCLHQLLLLGLALASKQGLSQAGFLPASSHPRQEVLLLGICLVAAGGLTLWMQNRMPAIWAWQKGWTQEAQTWLQRLFQEEEIEAHNVNHWVEERFVQYEVAQKQFASTYPFYELSTYFLLLIGVLGWQIVEGGKGFSL